MDHDPERKATTFLKFFWLEGLQGVLFVIAELDLLAGGRVVQAAPGFKTLAGSGFKTETGSKAGARNNRPC